MGVAAWAAARGGPGDLGGARIAAERVASFRCLLGHRAQVDVPLGPTLLQRAVRVPDPTFKIRDGWIVRRLAPDCSRIELADLPSVRDEERLLAMMGWETANLHLGSRGVGIRADLRTRPRRWLEQAAHAMTDVVESEWLEWSRR
jgi:hypothetical protein